ncbi:hypothetical protein NFI96_007722 [Prochilodus magdalenae]|nr:hypothetical protein NFI96_007722 [Prochilodus magdalenae]
MIDISKQPAGFDLEVQDQWLLHNLRQQCTEAAVHAAMEGTEHLHETPAEDDVLPSVLGRHKKSLRKKYGGLSEGNKTEENKILLNRIYTQLYILEGGTYGVNEEHEVLQIERTQRKHLQCTPINFLHIFKPGIEMEEEKAVKSESLRLIGDQNLEVPEIRSVLTTGIAGIGKTVSVQKFILDWAEGKANQDVEFMFMLPFRELNLIKDDPYSLHGLLCEFHPRLKDLDPKIYDQIKAVFIFDGLDESRIPLDFEKCEKVSDVTIKTSVGVLMTNLIKRDLLPSALIWITSRPAAANQIPPQYINRVTEIQGFSDPQKEEYFRKRISDEDQARRIISHIKTVRSLHIMCHIPVFCWISATVLQQIMKQGTTEIPRTLTEMYSHFLLTQTHMKNEKYEEKDERDPKNLLESNRTILLKLAQLAFKQLMEGNVMFYEEDLRESSIDVTEASVYSGIFTEIFSEECVLYQRKIYCFVHLSFQEFLAAVYVFHCYESNDMEALQVFNLSYRWWPQRVPLDEVLKGAVHRAVESQNGHLDLFLRFLLGISLESNQRLLQGLLTPTQSSSEGTSEYIKDLIKTDDTKIHNISTERAINLFLCLSEMNDQSLCRELQEYLQTEKLSNKGLSPGQCSALACMLLVSEEELEELDLRKYNTSEEGYRRLIPALAACRNAQLDGCYLTKDSCETLCSVLQSAHSFLKCLDLNNNDLQDLGVEMLCAGLQSSCCKLERLRLAGCNLTTKSCETLCSVLQSVNSSLKELDLSNNDLQDSGVELLSGGLMSSHCKLEILRLAICNLGEKACKCLGLVLQLANSSLNELDLSNNDLQDTGVKLLAAVYGVKSVKTCSKLEIIRLSGCMVTDEGCASLASALKSDLSHVRELDLTYNHPGESGVKLLSELLENPQCTLQILRLEHGGKIRMKPGLRKYACDLTLDPNTANTCLFLSERNRKVECMEEQQLYPDHPDRFTECLQVLSVETLTGRCYWEAEYSGVVTVAVAYRSVKRKERIDEKQLTVKCRPHYLPREFTAVFVIAVYIAPDANANNALKELHDNISSLQNKHPEAFYVVAGDFNHVNLTNILPRFYQHIDIPTRGNNTLDRVYTNVRDAYRAVPHLGLSDHISIMLVPAYHPPLRRSRPTQKTITVWPSDADAVLQDCFGCTDWHVFREAAESEGELDLEDYTSAVLGYISKCVEDVTTTKTVTCYPNQKPWLNGKVRSLLKARDAAFRSGDSQELRRARRELTAGVKRAKAAYALKIQGHFSSQDPRSMWRGIKCITDYKTRDAQCSKDPSLPEALNKFYARFEDPDTPPSIRLTPSPGKVPLSVTPAEVRRTLRRINPRKSAGPDDIPGRVLRECADQISEVLADIFNVSLTQAAVPTCLKTTTIIPVPKSSTVTGLNDYRPIALTPIVTKCFERLVMTHIKATIDVTVDPHQYAYRRNRSTDDAISSVVHTALTHLEQKDSYVRMLFVDFTSAFNTMIPQTLTGKLFSLGLRSSLCNWVLDFLTNRPQSVRIHNLSSSTTILSTGSPQGCVLSPLLFTLLTYDCSPIHPGCHIVKFADDTAVVGCITNSDESGYRQEVEHLEGWCRKNNLCINVKKTKEMIVDFRRGRHAHLPLHVGGSAVEVVSSYRYLGVHLTCSNNTSSLVRKAHQRLYFLRRLRRAGLGSPVLTSFYRCVVESVLCSSINVWHGSCSAADRKALQRVVKAAQREPAITRTVKKLTEALKDCFRTTLWEELCDPYVEDIDGLTHCITDYVNFCVENTVPTKTVGVSPTSPGLALI